MPSWLKAAAVTLLLGGCGGEEQERAVAPRPERRDDVPDSGPQFDREELFAQLLATRRSVRRFDSESLTSEQIGALFWAAQGAVRSGRRTAPSAGATYPLELFALTPEGALRYAAASGRVEKHRPDDLRARLAGSAQRMVATAPVVFVVAGVYERTRQRYGARAERYVHMEAGHAAQNLLLGATVLGLGGTPVGAFDDDTVRKALELPDDHAPLYLIPIGHPATD